MKRTVILFCCLSLLVLNSCKKDQDLQAQLDDQSEVLPSLKRTCGKQHIMDRLMTDPDYRARHAAKLDKMSKMSTERSALCATPTVLPVAVHFQGISNPDAACLQLLAKNQIDIVNQDYTGTNNDISTWTNTASSSFPGISFGETCVEFCLATKNHPSGYNLSNGDLAVTINQTSGDNVSDWSGYINIFVRPNLGFLGYSPLGGDGNGDGVVVDANAFASGAGCGSVSPQSPYDLGRTLTHELGHYLLLDHIWGGNGGCNDDDGVADTPTSADSYYGCPNIGEASCGNTDLHMNYMDYTNDACMYMFTNGQSVRMENYFNSNLQNVISNASNVCGEGGGPPNPTCNDGIQNGDETGVDCGGSCAPCEVTPTCNDGIQNGDETGVDCGGSCAPCPVDPTCDDGIQNGQETGVDCGGPDCAPCNISSCDTPNDISAEVLGVSAALITWSDVFEAQSYAFRYRIEGSANWTVEEVFINGITLTNLETETTYEYQVKSICADGDSPFSPLRNFTTECTDTGGGGGSSCDGTEVSFELILDEYGSETTWELVNEYDEVLAEGGGYQDNSEGTLISEDFCLEDGCYYFVVYDSYGDGICCFYGEGSFAVLDENGEAVAESTGQFGYYDYLDICVEGGEIDSISFRTDKRTAAKSVRQEK